MKQVRTFAIIGTIYLFAVYTYSYFFGLPPFNRGVILGYPAIYYEFYIGCGEYQWGFTNVLNLLCNIGIVLFLHFCYVYMKKLYFSYRNNR